jgi:hypothetical protein
MRKHHFAPRRYIWVVPLTTPPLRGVLLPLRVTSTRASALQSYAFIKITYLLTYCRKLFFFFFSNLCRETLGTAATTGLLYRWWWVWRNWRNEDWQGKPKYSAKTYPRATLSTTNHTWLVVANFLYVYKCHCDVSLYVYVYVCILLKPRQ